MVCGLWSQPLPESFQSADLGCRFQTCQPHNPKFLEINHFICMYNLLALFFWKALIQGRRCLLVRTPHLKLLETPGLGTEEESLAAQEKVWGEPCWDLPISNEMVPHTQRWGLQMLHLDHGEVSFSFLCSCPMIGTFWFKGNNLVLRTNDAFQVFVTVFDVLSESL